MHFYHTIERMLHKQKNFYRHYPAIYYRSTLNDNFVFVIGVCY